MPRRGDQMSRRIRCGSRLADHDVGELVGDDDRAVVRRRWGTRTRSPTCWVFQSSGGLGGGVFIVIAVVKSPSDEDGQVVGVDQRLVERGPPPWRAASRLPVARTVSLRKSE